MKSTVEVKKQRSAYKSKKFCGNAERATLTERSKAVLDQLGKYQSLVWFGIPDKDSNQIKIEILPTCEHNSRNEEKLNKDGKPYTFQGKEIPVIEGKPPITNNNTSKFRSRPGVIHVAAAKFLGISDDGIGTGDSCAGGYMPLFFGLRFRSTSHNSWAFKPHPLFVHLYTNDFITNDDINREVPYKEAHLIAEEFKRYNPNKFNKILIGLEKQQIEFEHMSEEKLREMLQKKVDFYIERKKYGLVANLISDCKDEKITLNFNEIMYSAIKNNSANTINWLIKEKKIDYNLVHPDYGTFLDYAITLKANRIANSLLEKTDLKLCDPNQLLLFVLRQEPPNLSLIQNLINLDVKKSIVHQALQEAIKKEPLDLDIIKILLQYSFNKIVESPTILEKINLFQKREDVRFLLDNNLLEEKQIEILLCKAAAFYLLSGEAKESSSMIDIDSIFEKACLHPFQSYQELQASLSDPDINLNVDARKLVNKYKEEVIKNEKTSKNLENSTINQLFIIESILQDLSATISAGNLTIEELTKLQINAINNLISTSKSSSQTIDKEVTKGIEKVMRLVEPIKESIVLVANFKAELGMTKLSVEKIMQKSSIIKKKLMSTRLYHKESVTYCKNAIDELDKLTNWSTQKIEANNKFYFWRRTQTSPFEKNATEKVPLLTSSS